MGEALTVLVIIVGVAGVHWLLSDLEVLASDQDQPSGRVSVVIPARNEADSLPAVLRALRESSLVPFEILVVDDDSLDETAVVARAGAARVVVPGPPPPGWTGKAWACHIGAEQSTGELILFLDADTILAPDALGDLVTVLRREGGLVSVQPFHEVRRAHEQLSAYFNAVSLIASGAFAPRPPDRPMAFGPCLLSSRGDYLRAGGHEAVREAILDDIRLAECFHASGLPVTVLAGGDRIRMRSYPAGLDQLISGWGKNIGAGAASAAALPALLTVAWIVAHHLVAVGAFTAGVAAASGALGAALWPTLGGWLVAWIVVAAQLRAVLQRIGSFRWWTWALFPLPLLAFDVIFGLSILNTVVRRRVRWRGRDVAVGGVRS